MSQHPPAALLNPKAFKKQNLVNGTSPSSPSASTTSSDPSRYFQLEDIKAHPETSSQPPPPSQIFHDPTLSLATIFSKMSEVPQSQAHELAPQPQSEGQPHLDNGVLSDGEPITSDAVMSDVAQDANDQSLSPPLNSISPTPSKSSTQPAPGVDASAAIEEHLADDKSDNEGRQKPASPAAAGPLKLDPRALLNPKAAAPAQQVNGTSGPDSRKRSSPLLSSKPTAVPEPLFDFGKTADTNLVDPDGERGGGDTAGFSKLIEQTHGISERDFRAAKKLKTAHNGNSVSWSGGRGGDISEHIAQTRTNALQDPGFLDNKEEPPQQPQEMTLPNLSRQLPDEQEQNQGHVVDLTEGKLGAKSYDTSLMKVDGDDEVTITGSITNIPDPGDEEVCFGTVEGASISAHRIPNPAPTAKTLLKGQWPMIKVRLSRQKARKTLHILCYDGRDQDFGQLHPHCAYGIAQVYDAGLLSRMQGRIPNRKREPYEIPGQDTSDRLPLLLNLYGKRRYAKNVATQLARMKVMLRRPLQFDRDVEYVNPFEEDTRAKARATEARGLQWNSHAGLSRTVEEIESSVMQIFDNSQETGDVPEMEADLSVIKTPLLAHQKQALYFMSTKESGHDDSKPEEDAQGKTIFHGNPLWRLMKERNGNSHYYNVVSGHTQKEKPAICRGGILADMMGLGKTLSVLSLCASTMDTAKEWAVNAPVIFAEGTELFNIKSTLLVAPLSVIQNWEEQIKAHTHRDKMSIYVYHAKNRETKLKVLGTYDLIVTTYSIVSSELRSGGSGRSAGPSPFRTANFFRIVLDEAHAIREPTTLQSRAICALSGPRRWAITGTPIQNKLEDFGSLLRFIKLYPFDTQFRSAIITPFKNADPDVIPKLRILVDSVTLRRTKDRLDLPKRHEETIRLDFSDHEFRLYKYLTVDGRRRAQAVTSQQRMAGKGLATLLRVLVACRTVCDATDLLNEEDMKLAEGYSEGMPIELDDEEASPELSERTAYEMLSLFEQTDMTQCARCKDNVMEKEYESGVIGYMLSCFQITCPSCIAHIRPQIEQTTSGHTANCPFCESHVNSQFFELSHEGFDKAKNRAEELKKKPRQKIVSRYTGPSTKTSALVSRLLDTRCEDEDAESKGLSKQKNKNVVFSCWTSYLDLLEMALEEAEKPFKFVRLDGKMSRDKRKASLDAFNNDPEVTVLLASIGTGGLGLNLVVANYVYIMEPQWNPAAEAQAVDRVHRLGQKRDVKVIKFIMEKSIELGMVEMQKKKLDLADLSMTKRKLDKKEAAKERLLGLAQLFK